MINTKVIEVMVGIFVALGIAALVMLSIKVSSIGAFSEKDGYALSMRFDNIGGLKAMSPVSIGGVRIGRVTSIEFDQKDYEAIVHVNINRKYNRLPLDTIASIFTSGLLGEQYVGLEAGGDEAFLSSGGEINETQSALVIEQLIGQFLFSKAAE